jgi:hypothetical protein
MAVLTEHVSATARPPTVTSTCVTVEAAVGATVRDPAGTRRFDFGRRLA